MSIKQVATEAKLSHEEFALRAIEKLRTGKYLGIHTVYSGFNSAFRFYFPNDNPVLVTQYLAAAGKLTVQLVRGGAMIYNPKDKPQSPVESPNKVLVKILAG